jgi:multiple sugar transport system permease protein
MAPARRASRRRRRGHGPLWARVAKALVVAGILGWSVGPIAVGLLTSISTQAEVTAVPAVWVPPHPSLATYREILTGRGGEGASAPEVAHAFVHAMLSSSLVAVETTLVTLVLSVLAGYAFARLRFRGRSLLLGAIVATLAIPVFALVAPLFRLMVNLHLMDTNAGLVLVYVSAIAPLAMWLFTSYCKDLPVEPEEAAVVDGCTRLQALLRVVLPQMAPGIGALTAIVFLAAWSQFLIPLLFAPSGAHKPVTVLVTEFAGRYTANYPLVAAAGMVAILPPALVALTQSRRIRGMLEGSGL